VPAARRGHRACSAALAAGAPWSTSGWCRARMGGPVRGPAAGPCPTGKRRWSTLPQAVGACPLSPPRNPARSAAATSPGSATLLARRHALPGASSLSRRGPGGDGDRRRRGPGNCWSVRRRLDGGSPESVVACDVTSPRLGRPAGPPRVVRSAERGGESAVRPLERRPHGRWGGAESRSGICGSGPAGGLGAAARPARRRASYPARSWFST